MKVIIKYWSTQIGFEYKIALVYCAIGFSWIYFSDTFFNSLISDKETLAKLQLVKGSFYVIVTALLLFVMVRLHIRKLKRVEKLVSQRNNEIIARNIELQKTKETVERSEESLRKRNEEYEIINQALQQNNAELKRAKEKAEESDKLKMAFIQNLSHEIRTPMNGIVGFVELLQLPHLPSEKHDVFLETVSSSAQQLLAIVDDILTISLLETRQETCKKTTVQVNLVLKNLFNSFTEQVAKQKLDFRIVVPPLNEGELYTDASKLTKILTLLIENALKFTPKGFVQIGYEIAEDSFSFHVQDSGIGIAPEHQTIIFDSFRQADIGLTRDYGGNGLGLAIAKGYVELLGGKIWVKSEPNCGATFLFTIPCHHRGVA